MLTVDAFQQGECLIDLCLLGSQRRLLPANSSQSPAAHALVLGKMLQEQSERSLIGIAILLKRGKTYVLIDAIYDKVEKHRDRHCVSQTDQQEPARDG